MSEDKYKSAYIYLSEDYYNNPKESSKFFGNIILSNIQEGKDYSVLDIGSAKGEFLYYLKSISHFKKMVGIDISESLINEAKHFQGLSDVVFHCDDAENFHLGEKFDFIIMIGVLSFFDNTEKALANIARHLNKEGVAFIAGLFNPCDVDVLMKYRNNKYSDDFEPGWNNHSIETVKKTLNKLDMEVTRIREFELPIELQKRDDPSRSWTLQTEEGQKLVNGLGLIYNIMMLEIVFKT